MDPGKRCAEGIPPTLREFVLLLCWSQSGAAAVDELPTVPVARHKARGRLVDDNVTVGLEVSCRAPTEAPSDCSNMRLVSSLS
jgi:hypothetical protein